MSFWGEKIRVFGLKTVFRKIWNVKNTHNILVNTANYLRMNKYLLYFLFRLCVAISLKIHFSGWVNPRVCRFVHKKMIHLQHGVSCPTTDDIRKYAVASQFAYFKENETLFEDSLADLKKNFGDNVIYVPFYKDGTENEIDVEKRILAGYFIKVKKKQGNEMVVAFRGTKKKEWNEWKNNMDSIPILRHFYRGPVGQDKPVFSLWVHRGILKEYDRCRSDFLKKIKQEYCGGELVFVGHSKGIISQLGALDYVVNYDIPDRPFPIHLITFGAYKVFAHLQQGVDPHTIFKKLGLYCSQVRFVRDPVVNYPYFRSCYQHVFDTRVFLKHPPNSLLEHSIYNYKRFFMDIPPFQQGFD